MSRCEICERPLEHDHDPHQPKGHYGDEAWLVATRNGIYADACWSCWFKWPDERKIFPPIGFGRWPGDEPKRSHITREELVELVGPA